MTTDLLQLITSWKALKLLTETYTTSSFQVIALLSNSKPFTKKKKVTLNLYKRQCLTP